MYKPVAILALALALVSVGAGWIYKVHQVEFWRYGVGSMVISLILYFLAGALKRVETMRGGQRWRKR